jgi:hypothetical protein
MPQNIHIFETRIVHFLKPYMDKATSLGFNVTLSNNTQLDSSRLFKEFREAYIHYSINPPEFEIACFARYFAIAAMVENDEPFLLTDTDVYITKAFRELQGYRFNGAFVGSEGFDTNGSVGQISPHCTFWDRALLMNFIQFTLGIYKTEQETGFLKNYYQTQSVKYPGFSISDMNLIYLWIEANKVPYINSNSTKFQFGIDHNISTLLCEDDEFKHFAGRKYLKIKADEITCFLKSGKTQDMALLHFQGSYKAILARFYAGKYAKFAYFSLRNNYRINKKIFSK